MMAGDELATTVESESKPPTERDVLDGWTLVSIGDLIDNQTISVRNGFAQGGFNEDWRGVPHLRPFNVTVGGAIDLSQIKSIVPPSTASPYWVRQGDVIFNNTNTELDFVQSRELKEQSKLAVLRHENREADTAHGLS